MFNQRSNKSNNHLVASSVICEKNIISGNGATLRREMTALQECEVKDK